MGHPAGVKRDRVKLEQRRLKAARLLKQGLHEAEGHADRQRIVQGLKRGPRALGYGTSLWTAWRVADLIERECGVKYSTVHTWRLLRDLGWTPQRPRGPGLGT